MTLEHSEERVASQSGFLPAYILAQSPNDYIISPAQAAVYLRIEIISVKNAVTRGLLPVNQSADGALHFAQVDLDRFRATGSGFSDGKRHLGDVRELMKEAVKD